SATGRLWGRQGAAAPQPWCPPRRYTVWLTDPTQPDHLGSRTVCVPTDPRLPCHQTANDRRFRWPLGAVPAVVAASGLAVALGACSSPPPAPGAPPAAGPAPTSTSTSTPTTTTTTMTRPAPTATTP